MQSGHNLISAMTLVTLVGRCDMLNDNTENKFVKNILVTAYTEMAGIKFRIHKDYTIQFSIKFRKFQLGKSNISKMSVTLNGLYEFVNFLVMR